MVPNRKFSQILWQAALYRSVSLSDNDIVYCGDECQKGKGDEKKDDFFGEVKEEENTGSVYLEMRQISAERDELVFVVADRELLSFFLSLFPLGPLETDGCYFSDFEGSS